MKKTIAIAIGLSCFSINAERVPLIKEQLEREADQICTGTIVQIQNGERKCSNYTCTNYTMYFNAQMETSSCSRANTPVIYARFFKVFHNEGWAPPGAYGHNPKPMAGQTGTLYVKNGEIVYPNGWVIER